MAPINAEHLFRFLDNGAILCTENQYRELGVMDKVITVRRERKDMVRNLERVLQAANELFAERGGNVTMEEVARRAGVGVGTVYRRFPSKEHLFAAVSHAACNDTRHCLQQAASAAPDAATRLRALIHTLYQRCEQQSALLDPTHGLQSADRPTAAEQQYLYAAVYEMIRHTISEGQRQGTFSPGSAAARAVLCTELLTPHAYHQLAQLTGGDADQIADDVARFMLNGLGADIGFGRSVLPEPQIPSPPPAWKRALSVLIRWLISTLAIFVAVLIVPGIEFTGPGWQLGVVAAVFGLINVLLRPILSISDMPAHPIDLWPVRAGDQRRPSAPDFSYLTKSRRAVPYQRLLASSLGRPDHRNYQRAAQSACWRNHYQGWCGPGNVNRSCK